MNLREVREAAELYKTGEGKSEDRFRSFELMANYVLATIDPEPESATGCGRCTSNQEQGTGVMK